MEERGVEGRRGVVGEVYHALAEHTFPSAVLRDSFGGGASPEESVGLRCKGAVGVGG